MSDRPALAALLPPIEAVDALAPELLPALVAGLAALQGRAAARLAAVAGNGAPSTAQCEGDPARLLTIPEVAERLQVPRQHAYELARRELPAVRFGKYVRVRATDLDTWVARHRDSP